ncbi:MAG TPA: F0F1 ATP synthase subunit B [Fimbriimonadaceae bacterium]|nr:F0F1 ATP synthase subunit B [Fimbriimonadaceae bacterium]
MSDNTKTFRESYWFKLVVGAAIMVFGMYGSGKGWGSPAFITDLGLPLDLMKTVAFIGVFIILFPLLNVFYFQPLTESINNRTKSLEDTFSEAEQLRSEMDAMKSDYEAKLSKTESDARERIQTEVKKAQELRVQIQAEANAKAEEMLRKAREEINAERDKVMTEVRVHVANLSLLATERILGENMDNERNRKLVEEFLDKVEVPNA